MLPTSISASYKTKYGLDDQRHMTQEYISNAIRMEIRDELKIEIDRHMGLSQNIFAFYRDLVEGGKPQFLFYLELPDLTKDQFVADFENEYNDRQKRKADKKNVLTDGNKFEYFTAEQLSGFQYNVDSIVTGDGVKYKMMPSSIVSVVLLLRFLGRE